LIDPLDFKEEILELFALPVRSKYFLFGARVPLSVSIFCGLRCAVAAKGFSLQMFLAFTEHQLKNITR
jgi:hypothetical protein